MSISSFKLYQKAFDEMMREDPMLKHIRELEAENARLHEAHERLTRAAYRVTTSMLEVRYAPGATHAEVDRELLQKLLNRIHALQDLLEELEA